MARYKDSSDVIVIRSNNPFVDERPLLSVATGNKADIDVLPGSLVVEATATRAGVATFGVQLNTNADGNVPMLIAVEGAEMGLDLDTAYVSADSSSVADFSQAPLVKYVAVQSGDIVQLRIGDANAIAIGDFLAPVAGGTAGSQVNGCFGKDSDADGANAKAVALEAIDQANANDKGLIKARVI